MVGEWYEAHGCVDKHPFHDGDSGIFGNKVSEYGKIDGETDLCRQAEQISPHTTRFACSCALTAQYKYQGSHSTDENAQDFLAGHRFFQVNGCHNHCDDRGGSAYDGCVDRRGEG